MDELDLNALGLKYDIVAPEGMCDFVSYHSFRFENFPIVQGPEEVSWTVHEDGSISNQMNAVDGEPICAESFLSLYSENEGAPLNCCYGNFTLTITQAGSGISTSVVRKWGGLLEPRCYHGAAFFDRKAVFAESNVREDWCWPLGIIYYIDRKAMVETVEYWDLSRYGLPNAVYANYFKPEEHQGGIPAAYEGKYSTPYYDIKCLDDADEIIAHIELMVREWNEEAEFDVDGDPDTIGLEPGWNTPINDLDDWADLAPGEEGYPRILPVPVCGRLMGTL
jgi:hypothetical protein